MPIQVSRSDCPSVHSLSNKIARVIWGTVWGTVFRFSPRIMFGWRRFLLRVFGAKIGKNARISPSVRIWAPWNLEIGDEASVAHAADCYCVAPLKIGAHATVSQYAFLCTASHDPTDPHMRLTAAPIVVADQCWVCAGVFVAPGVTMHQGAVAGAMSVVTKDVAAWTIVAGNPAKKIRNRELAGENHV